MLFMHCDLPRALRAGWDAGNSIATATTPQMNSVNTPPRANSSATRPERDPAISGATRSERDPVLGGGCVAWLAGRGFCREAAAAAFPPGSGLAGVLVRHLRSPPAVGARERYRHSQGPHNGPRNTVLRRMSAMCLKLVSSPLCDSILERIAGEQSPCSSIAAFALPRSSSPW
jgi:hypothetical protein